MMEAASTSETSVNFYQNIRRNNSEYSHLHTSEELHNLYSSTNIANMINYINKDEVGGACSMDGITIHIFNILITETQREETFWQT
jgi:hypothetical protein